MESGHVPAQVDARALKPERFTEIIRYVSKLYNATGMMVLYGWSPNEVSKMSFTAHFEHKAKE